MSIRREVRPFLFSVGIGFLLLAVALKAAGALGLACFLCLVALAGILCGYFLYFFRDPERTPPAEEGAVVAGADGVVAAIVKVDEAKHLKTPCVRISIFLSLFDVHVNRAPLAGRSTFLGYFPGKRLFTFQAKSSEVNQHNKILIEGQKTRCLICQIVGPVCRRVVYWPAHDQAVEIALGDRIGMMKFGSRLDMSFPASDVEVTTKLGDRVRAGETIIARWREHSAHEGADGYADGEDERQP